MAYLSIKGGSKEACSNYVLCRDLEIKVGDEVLEGVESIQFGKIVRNEVLSATIKLYVKEIDIDIPVQEVDVTVGEE